MAQARVNGVEIAYELRGAADGPPVLLIMGFNMTLAAWPESFLALLENAGLRLILMDNRDAGLSQRLADRGQQNVAAITMARLLGASTSPPYTLDDMADDCAGLLNALHIDRAHVVGVSMGGMIAQCLALRHPTRLASLALLMTHCGALRHSVPSPSLLSMTMQSPGPDPDEMLRYALQFWKAIAGPDYPPDEANIRDLMARSWKRSPQLNGRKRQLAAIAAAPDRTAQLRQLQLPTVVIHGASDPLVAPAGGRHLARIIPGASLDMIAGMGHDLPLPLHQRFVTDIVTNMARANESAVA